MGGDSCSRGHGFKSHHLILEVCCSNPVLTKIYLISTVSKKTYLAMLAIAKQTAARTSVSVDSRRPQMSSRPPTKLLTMSPELEAFWMHGLTAHAALA